MLYASDDELERAFTPALRRELSELVEWKQISPGTPITETNHTILLTGWGSGPIPADLITPELRAVFHLGGSVRGIFPQETLPADLIVVSARNANAVPVAEYALACIILAAKRAAQFADRLRRGTDYWSGALRANAGLFGARIGIVGLSATARHLLQLLRSFDVDVAVADPTRPDHEIRVTGARPLPLDALVEWCDILSLHAPSLPTTRGMIDAHRLATLRDGASVINTARGDLIDTAALTAQCAAGRLTAYLDVTDPEPLTPDSPLPGLEHAFVTPHIAGAMGSDVHRMTTFVLNELRTVIETGASAHDLGHTDPSLLA